MTILHDLGYNISSDTVISKIRYPIILIKLLNGNPSSIDSHSSNITEINSFSAYK